jgi:hypothetical protein
MLTLRSVPRHSHEFEVKSGMLVFPKPDGWDTEEWEKAELAAMKEVVGLYGKTWHFWQTDLGHEVPLGMLNAPCMKPIASQLIGSLRLSDSNGLLYTCRSIAYG